MHILQNLKHPKSFSSVKHLHRLNGARLTPSPTSQQSSQCPTKGRHRSTARRQNWCWWPDHPPRAKVALLRRTSCRMAMSGWIAIHCQHRLNAWRCVTLGIYLLPVCVTVTYVQRSFNTTRLRCTFDGAPWVVKYTCTRHEINYMYCWILNVKPVRYTSHFLVHDFA